MLRRSFLWCVSFTPIYMPSLSPSMESGKVVEWKKAVGDKIVEGEVWCTVETDKATVDYTNVMETGFLAAVYVGNGERVAVGKTIAVIVEDAEDVGRGKEYVVKDAAPAASSSAAADATVAAPPPPPASQTPASASAAPARRRYGNSIEEALAASGPSVARLTAGVDKAVLSAVVPSGKGGRFTKADFTHLPTFVYEQAEEASAAASAAPAPAAPAPSKKSSTKPAVDVGSPYPVIKRVAVKDFTVTDTKLIRALAAKIQKKSQQQLPSVACLEVGKKEEKI